jgi:hypothetical protein
MSAMARGNLSWEIVNRDGETLVTFSGVLDENSDLGALPMLGGAVTFDLGGVCRVTSGGVTSWIRMMAAQTQVARLAFVNCSVPVVAQLNMVRGFLGRAEVRSFYAPYICEASGDETLLLLTAAEVGDPLHPPEFDSPAGKVTLCDIPSRYFAFLSSR